MATSPARPTGSPAASPTAHPALARRLAPWAVVALLGGLLIGAMPSAQAQGGTSAADAIQVTPSGAFSGVAAAGKSVWFRFVYNGGGAPATVTTTYQPADSNRTDLFLFTGDPANPRQEPTSATRSGNSLSIAFTDPNPRDVLVKFENDHSDRAVSFVGTITPASTVATPTPVPTGTTTPTPGPVAPNAASALTIGADGAFAGTLGPNQPSWYRFYYNNPGANATVSTTFAPTASGTDLNVYTGSDPNNLTQQTGAPTTSGSTLSRTVNLSGPQFVYFTVVNNNAGATVAYAGLVSPAGTPPATPTAVATTATTTPVPSATPQAAPAVPHDAQYFAETGFRIDDTTFNYYQSHGGKDTFGYPVSRLFTFLGCPVQMFQRLVIQLCPGQGPALINLLDPEIFPYTQVNGSVFPGPDEALKNATPRVGSPEYGGIIQFIQQNTPDTFNGQPVNFYQRWQALGGLEVLGAPISRPAPDPSNASFIYMRFQRVILHYRAGVSTEPLLLADYLKAILANNANLPADLKAQAQSSRYFNQYCPGGTRWLCRPNDLQGTDLTFAFEKS